MDKPSKAEALEAARISDEIVAACRVIFTGKPRVAQGFATTELMAMWLAGYDPGGDPKLWDDLLQNQMETVRRLAGLYRSRYPGPKPEAGNAAPDQH